MKGENEIDRSEGKGINYTVSDGSGRYEGRSYRDEAYVPAAQSPAEKNPWIPAAHGHARREGSPVPASRQGAKASLRGGQRQEVTLPGRMGGARAGLFRFPKEERLRTDPEYRAVVRKGERTATPHFTVYRDFLGGDERKVGISVGRRVGNAVVRNRIRRVLREFCRLHKAVFPGGSRTAIVVKKSPALPALDTITAELLPAMLRRWGRKEESSRCEQGTTSSPL